jgi:hypothetical protein
MVAGDVVGGAFDMSVVGSYGTIQPAAGVELMIMTMAGDLSIRFILYDGTLSAWSTSTQEDYGTTAQLKIPISNTLYMQLYSTHNDYGWRGIQIK